MTMKTRTTICFMITLAALAGAPASTPPQALVLTRQATIGSGRIYQIGVASDGHLECIVGVDRRMVSIQPDFTVQLGGAPITQVIALFHPPGAPTTFLKQDSAMVVIAVDAESRSALWSRTDELSLGPSRFATSPNIDSLAYFNDEMGRIDIVAARSGVVTQHLTPRRRQFLDSDWVALSSEGSKLLMADRPISQVPSPHVDLEMMDIGTSTTLWNKTMGLLTVSALTFSPDGSKVILAAGGSVHDGVSSMASPTNSLSALASLDGHVIFSVLDLPGPPTSVSFSPDGSICAVGGVGYLSAYDAATGFRVVFTPLAPTCIITALAFTSSHRIVSGQNDGVVREWDLTEQPPL